MQRRLIEEIETRRNFFIRPAVANVNQVAIVMTRVSQEPDFLLVDKLLVRRTKNITPVLL